MGRVTHGKRNTPIQHRANSWKGRVYQQLKVLVKTMRGTPSTFALVISQRLGGVVSRQMVWDLLNNHNLTKKQQSPVPGRFCSALVTRVFLSNMFCSGFAIPGERAIYLKQLIMLWTQREQVSPHIARAPLLCLTHGLHVPRWFLWTRKSFATLIF
jgi:hypothetical protein